MILGSLKDLLNDISRNQKNMKNKIKKLFDCYSKIAINEKLSSITLRNKPARVLAKVIEKKIKKN